jgi:hypothetical protein
MSDHFYVTLFRNVSEDIYPSNTLAAFTIQLAQDIDLHPSEKWEVGLSEFSCPAPHTGTFGNVTIVGDTCGLIYCKLISPNLWVLKLSDA